jgi:hypothetical protein
MAPLSCVAKKRKPTADTADDLPRIQVARLSIILGSGIEED